MPAGSIPALTSHPRLRHRAWPCSTSGASAGGRSSSIWAAGMLFYGIASGCEAIGATSGWNEPLYRTWYLTGAIWTAGWLGLGTTFLLARTRFGYTFAVCLLLAGVFTLLTQQKFDYPGAGSAPILYLIAAVVLAVAVAVETYFQNDRWPMLAGARRRRDDAPVDRPDG